MKKPIVGLIASFNNEAVFSMISRYTYAVENSGGIPLILPLMTSESTLDRYVEMCDGIIFPGGVDVHPSRYGATVHQGCGEICPERDKTELLIIKKLLEADKPFIGICRGIQIINVAMGGTLYQDIPTEYSRSIAHQQPSPYSIPSHEVTIDKNSRLYSIVGQSQIAVNSMHHQAVKQLGKGVVATAFSPDGIIEAIEIPSAKFAIGFQWHPESLYKSDKFAPMIFDTFTKVIK